MTEYLFGLNPNVSDRYPWSTRAANGHVTLSYPTLAGGAYQVEYSSSLSSWNNGPAAVPGDGSTKQWTDNGSQIDGLPQRRLYRVRVQTAP